MILNSKFLFILALLGAMTFMSCGDDDDDLASSTFNYEFNTGGFAYVGNHPTDLGAQIKVDELANGNSRITISIMNTIDGETYPTHAHDKKEPGADMLPYDQSPNSAVFAGAIAGNGGTASMASESTMSYEEITTNYEGFFVVHDPLQDVNTADPTTYVILGDFAR